MSDIRTNGDYYLIFKVTFKIVNVGKTRRREVNRGKFVNSEKSKKRFALKTQWEFCNGELSVISNESDVI